MPDGRSPLVGGTAIRSRRFRSSVVLTASVVLLGAAALHANAGDPDWDQAVGLFNRALAAQTEARFHDAIDSYEQALEIYLEIGDLTGEATSLLGLGLCYDSLSEYERAIEYYEQLLAILLWATGDFPEVATILYRLGNCYYSLSEYEGAIEYYEQSLVIFKEIADFAGEAASLLGLGLCYYYLSECQQAIDLIEQVFEIYLEIGDRAGEAASLNALGNCYEALSECQRAVDYFGQALVIYVEIGDRAGEASSLNNLGVCHDSQSEYRRAIEYYKQALEIYLEIGDRAGEATSLNNLGNCHRFLSEYQRAIYYHKQSLAICVGIGNRAGEAASLNSLGGCYTSLSEYERSIELYGQSLAIRRALGNRIGEAENLNNLGVCYKSLSEYEQAIEYHEQSLAIKREIGDRSGETYSLHNLGICYHHLSEYERAIDYYEQSLAICAEIGRRGGEASCLASMGDSYDSLSEYERAMECYEEALEIAEAIGHEDTAWHTHLGLGRTHHKLDQLTEALEHYTAAVSIVEGIRERVDAEGLQQSFFSGAKELYEEYLELLFEVGDEASMLWYAERCRARSMLDLLAHGGIAVGEAVDGMTTQGTVDAEQMQVLLHGAPALLEEDEAVLTYTWGTEHLFTWVVTEANGILGPYAQEIDYDEALEQILTFRSLLEDSVDREAVLRDLTSLYELLIAPVSEHVEGYDTWVVVPSGPLWYVPYCALQAGQTSSYVIEEHVVAYAPSVASLSTILGKPEDVAPTPTLALANPLREDLPPLSVGLVDAMQDFVDATGGGSLHTEVDATEELLQGTLPAESERASYDYLALACHGIFRYGNPLYSYLALTATADETFGDGDLEAREVLSLGLDGMDLVMLAACETFLTAVESREDTAGIGHEQTEEEKLDILRRLTLGDEVVGLSRSFLLGGAKSVLATQWELYVPMAQIFLPRFGEKLAEGLPKGRALQQTLCDILTEKPYFSTDPWIWAPFLLIGDWR